MAVSPWVFSARWIVSFEALLGIVLNIALFVLLCRSNIGKEARLYRFCCMITAFLSFYTSFLLFLLQDLIIFVDDAVAVTLYGPLLFYLPNSVIDFLVIAFFAQVHMIWQPIAAPAIVQWMFLARPNSSAARRLIYAYSIPILFYVNAWFYMPYFCPDPAFKSELVTKIFNLHGTDLRMFHVYGVRVMDKTTVDVLDVMLLDAMPSYIASYGMFVFSALQIAFAKNTFALQIRSRLLRFGNVASGKTAQMQRRFFRIQVAQVFVPLALLSPSMAIALVAGLNGVNLANASFIVDFGLWLAPSATLVIPGVTNDREKSRSEAK